MQNEPGYSFYDHLKSHDILTILRPLLDSGSHELRKEDGRFIAKGVTISRDTPWIHTRQTLNFDCGLWHRITFNIVVAQLPDDQKFVPRHCQDCFKVCIRPRTLDQLFELLKVQQKMYLPSKCGIELRDDVHGLYGGYYYSKGLEAGLQCYDAVVKALSENEVLAPLLDEVDEDNRTTKVILKRGCTEFERVFPKSNEWKVTPEQNAIEDLIDGYVVQENMRLPQPDHLHYNIKRRWIEFAFKCGDPTYAKYNGDKPLFPKYVSFHQLPVIQAEEQTLNE
jgi:hypothetical protein